MCRNKDRKKGRSSDHYVFLCPKTEIRRREANKSKKENRKRQTLSEEQKQFIADFSSEMEEKFKRAFSNMAAVTNYMKNIHCSLKELSEIKELPVILVLLEGTINKGQKPRTLIDLASYTNYTTHRATGR